MQKGASYPAVTDAEVKSVLISFPKSLKTQQMKYFYWIAEKMSFYTI